MKLLDKIIDILDIGWVKFTLIFVIMFILYYVARLVIEFLNNAVVARVQYQLAMLDILSSIVKFIFGNTLVSTAIVALLMTCVVWVIFHSVVIYDYPGPGHRW
jgi:hypothetical protein